MALFKAGEMASTIIGREVRIESFDGIDDKGRERYTVITTDVIHTNKGPRNTFKAVIVPTLAFLKDQS